MKKIVPCKFNWDNCCVELRFFDGSMIAIDTIAVENQVAIPCTSGQNWIG